MEKEINRIMDDSKPSEWIGTSVKQVRLIYGTELPRLQSDINQELLTLTLTHNQIESIRTYPFVQLNTLRYVGEIIYSTPYMKVPKEDIPTKPLENPPRQNETKATEKPVFIGDKVVNKKK